MYIICITNYDPFGYDEMVYTIKNGCVEVPELCYNDGVRILYFNTTGTKGGNKSLKNFLRYLEESVASNVVDEATEEANKYVEHVKSRRPEMYTVGDWIDNIVAEELEQANEEIAKKDEAIQQKDKEIASIKAELERMKRMIDSQYPD